MRDGDVDSRDAPLYVYKTREQFAAHMTEYVYDALLEGPHGWRVVALVGLWIAAPAFYVAFFPHLGELLAPVAVYMLVLCVMASFALAARTHSPLVAVGSLIFVGSDTLIGVGRFLGGFPGIEYLIWGLYALAQVTIVAGVFHETAARTIRP